MKRFSTRLALAATEFPRVSQGKAMTLLVALRASTPAFNHIPTMSLSQINFRALARDFCRKTGFNNVDLIEAAMIASAETVVDTATALVKDACDDLKDKHAKNLRGH